MIDWERPLGNVRFTKTSIAARSGMSRKIDGRVCSTLKKSHVSPEARLQHPGGLFMKPMRRSLSVIGSLATLMPATLLTCALSSPLRAEVALDGPVLGPAVAEPAAETFVDAAPETPVALQPGPQPLPPAVDVAPVVPAPPGMPIVPNLPHAPAVPGDVYYPGSYVYRRWPCERAGRFNHLWADYCAPKIHGCLKSCGSWMPKLGCGAAPCAPACGPAPCRPAPCGPAPCAPHGCHAPRLPQWQSCGPACKPCGPSRSCHVDLFGVIHNIPRWKFGLGSHASCPTCVTSAAPIESGTAPAAPSPYGHSTSVPETSPVGTYHPESNAPAPPAARGPSTVPGTAGDLPPSPNVLPTDVSAWRTRKPYKRTTPW